MSKLKHKNNNFNIRYRQYIRNSVDYNTKNNIIKAAKQDTEYDKRLRKHLPEYENTNQTMIGTYLFTLLYQARNNSENYMSNRLNVLKSLYSFVEENSAWYDLWKTFTILENNLHKNNFFPDPQLSSEIHDTIRLNMKYPKWIVGLKSKETAFIDTPNFYVTGKLLNFLEGNKSVGRKKSIEQQIIQFQTMEILTYHVYSYGLYSESTLDLLPSNGLKYKEINNYNLPRKIEEYEAFSDLINNKRQYTMNPSGVVIDCFNCGDIDQITLVENEGYLLWKVHFSKDGYLMNHKGDLVEDHRGAEFSGYFTPQLIPRSTLSEHIDYLDFEMKIYEFILECYAEIVCGSNAINSQIDRDMLNVGAMKMKEDNEELDGRLGLRFITRNTYKKVRDSSSNKKDYENEVNKYFVSGHIRKLPENHNPSKEATISALEYGVELPNGYTFVKPYESGDEKLRTRLVKTI